jgi:hypothetical protein
MSKRMAIKCRPLIRKRKEWRLRALKAAVEFATFPAGKPGREKVEAELHKSLAKIDLWYRGGGARARRVVLSIQRRAVNTYRQQA